MTRNKEDVKKITKALVILATMAMTGCGSATTQPTSETPSVKTDAVQAAKVTPENNKSDSKKNNGSGSEKTTAKDNSKSSDKKSEDSKNENKENTSDNKQSVDNKSKDTGSNQSQGVSKQSDSVQNSPSTTVKQNTPSVPSSSATKSQTCKTVHHDAQYETIIHPAETHTVHHDATGHYENQIVGYHTVEYVVCNCGLKFSSDDEYAAHAEPLVLAGDYVHGGWYVDWEDVPDYGQVWVEDKSAYDETVTDKEQWTENKLVKDAYDETVCQ